MCELPFLGIENPRLRGGLTNPPRLGRRNQWSEAEFKVETSAVTWSRGEKRSAGPWHIIHSHFRVCVSRGEPWDSQGTSPFPASDMQEKMLAETAAKGIRIRRKAYGEKETWRPRSFLLSLGLRSASGWWRCQAISSRPLLKRGLGKLSVDLLPACTKSS